MMAFIPAGTASGTQHTRHPALEGIPLPAGTKVMTSVLVQVEYDVDLPNPEDHQLDGTRPWVQQDSPASHLARQGSSDFKRRSLL